MNNIKLTLCDEDRDHFLEVMKNPLKLNQKIKEAFEYYYETKLKSDKNYNKK